MDVPGGERREAVGAAAVRLEAHRRGTQDPPWAAGTMATREARRDTQRISLQGETEEWREWARGLLATAAP